MSTASRSEPRDGYKVRVLCVHTTEGGGTARQLCDAAWWTGSCHAIADPSGTLLTPADGCVPYDRAAWTLRSGNRWSENIELVAYASWSRARWLAEDALLDACARWLADRATARGIPLRKLTPAQYRAGWSGVIGHHDHTIGYSDGTHWDPGPGFPWDVVIARAKAYQSGENMPSVSEVWNYDVGGESGDQPAWAVLSQAWTNSKSALDQLAGLGAAVNKLIDVVATGRDDLTAEELRQAVSDGIQDAGAAVRAAAADMSPPRT